MDEFGESPSFYVYPTRNSDGSEWEYGTTFGEDFYERLSRALASEGLDWEAV